MTAQHIRPSAAGSRDAVGHLRLDVQQLGLLTAATVVDRYARLVEQAVRGGDFPPQGDTLAVPGIVAATTAQRAVETGLASVAAVLADLGRAVTPWDEPGEPDRLVLAAAPGAVVEVTLWLHRAPGGGHGVGSTDGGGTPAWAATTVHASDLVTGQGARLPGRVVTAFPEPTGGRDNGPWPVRLQVAVPLAQPPGRYHGVLLLDVEDAEPLPMVLDVAAGSASAGPS